MTNFRSLALKFLGLSLILALFFSGPLDGLQEKVSYLTVPVRKSISSAAFYLGDQFEFFSSLRRLARENKELEKEVLRLENELKEMENLVQENKELRRLLSLSVQGESNIMSVRVIGWDSSSSGGMFLIDAGSSEAVVEGLPVIYEGHLVGQVWEVQRGSSYVRVTCHPSFRTSAVSSRLGEESLGVVHGYMPGKLMMKDIYPNVSLEVGDEIVTSGKEEKMPAGLVLGKVTEVQEKGVLKEAVISLPVNLRSLDEVFVLQ